MVSFLKALHDSLARKYLPWPLKKKKKKKKKKQKQTKEPQVIFL
jgi:hypothetical protein